MITQPKFTDSRRTWAAHEGIPNPSTGQPTYEVVADDTGETVIAEAIHRQEDAAAIAALPLLISTLEDLRPRLSINDQVLVSRALNIAASVASPDPIPS